MTDNIKEQLRDHMFCATGHECVLCTAADRIEELEADNKLAWNTVSGLCTLARTTLEREAADHIEELKTLLCEAREELACYINQEHPYRNQYKDEMRRWNRDMNLCYRIDDALKDTQESPTET